MSHSKGQQQIPFIYDILYFQERSFLFSWCRIFDSYQHGLCEILTKHEFPKELAKSIDQKFDEADLLKRVRELKLWSAREPEEKSQPWALVLEHMQVSYMPFTPYAVHGASHRNSFNY